MHKKYILKPSKDLQNKDKAGYAPYDIYKANLVFG